MAITGHETASVDRRYRIVNEEDIRSALERVDRDNRAGGPRGLPADPVPLPFTDKTRTVERSSRPVVVGKLAEGEGFEPPRASRPGGFQVAPLTPLHRLKPLIT